MTTLIRNNEVLGVVPSVFSVSDLSKVYNDISDKNKCECSSDESIRNSVFRLMRGRVTAAFRPLRIILCLLGRFPFEVSDHHTPKKLVSVPGMWLSLRKFLNWTAFLVTTVLLLFLLLMTTLGFTIFYLSWEIGGKSKHFADELKLFNANLVPFVLFWACLFHAVVGSIAFVVNRKFIVKYFYLWNQVVDDLHVPLPCCVRRFLIYSNIIAFIFSLLITVIYCQDWVPVARGTAKLLVLLTLRPFFPVDENVIESEATYFSGVAIGIILYVVYSSRALVIFFSFKCRLLKACFLHWNQRLRMELNFDSKSEYFSDCKLNKPKVTVRSIVDKYLDESNKEECEKFRLDKLFRDHCTLIRMIRKTDGVFAAILQSYYLTQVLNMCFELYYLARTSCFTSKGGRDREDIAAACLLIAQTFHVFFTVSLEAAHVNDAAMEGFQIIRLRGIHVSDSMEKKYLIQNLLVNYSQQIALSGGRFFQLDRPFIIKVLGAVFTYFVIILQFGSQIGGECGGGSGDSDG